MPVAEEVHFLFPEQAHAQERLQNDPGHVLFKRFGESMPKSDWNAGGTKQGIYMIGPNGEYLEGTRSGGGQPDRLVKRLETALLRWDQLRKTAPYANKAVPRGKSIAPPEIKAAPLAFVVYLRDLPREKDKSAGRRFTKDDIRNRPWMDFTKWAWNQNWLTMAKPDALVPKGTDLEAVAPAIVERICRRALVDNVRGQNAAWSKSAVKAAQLSMVVINETDGLATIEYKGHALLETDSERYAPSLYGQAVWNRTKARFESFSLISIGQRSGSARFNQREGDQGPAPLGIAIELL